MDDWFILDLQRNIASRSIGASTVRGMGPKGTAAAARIYLTKLNLTNIHGLSEKQFMNWLNKNTEDFQSELPPGGGWWGSARKYLNIFLRHVNYNRFLCDAFDLSHIESFLEVPLDSQVAKALRKEHGGSALPRWKTVKGLDWKTNKLYQDFASEIAAGKRLSRVHLDVLYWRRGSNG